MLISIAAKLSWRLARMGIYISPYYWFKEGDNSEPLYHLEDEQNFSFGFLDATDLKIFAANEPDSYPIERLTEFLTRLRNGKYWFGAKYRNEIIAMMFIDFDEAVFLKKTIPLAEHEAYLGDIFTKEKFRGKNVAPHLRNRAYAVLRDMGKTRYYSYSDAFNASAIRFKEKLQAKILWLGLYVEVFGKYHWHWKLKDYVKHEAGVR